MTGDSLATLHRCCNSSSYAYAMIAWSVLRQHATRKRQDMCIHELTHPATCISSMSTGLVPRAPSSEKQGGARVSQVCCTDLRAEKKSEITARFSLSKSITSSRSGSVPTVLHLTLSYVVDYVDITIWSYRMAGIHRVLCRSRGRSLMFTIARSRLLAQHALERDRVVPDLACCCCIAALEAWSGGIPALRLEYRIAAHANEHRVSGTHVRRTRRWMLSAS